MIFKDPLDLFDTHGCSIDVKYLTTLNKTDLFLIKLSELPLQNDFGSPLGFLLSVLGGFLFLID